MGSTGSIGTQALQVIKENPGFFSVEVLAANSNADLLIKQAIEFEPNAVVIADESKYQQVKDALYSKDIKVFTGLRSIEQIVEMDSIDLVLAAIVGYAGLASTLNAIKQKKNIALANKETLVVAGEMVSQAVVENGVSLLPVDSEHSAIFQCLAGEMANETEKIILTASGGPFRGKKTSELQHVKAQQALKHPNWNMGAKITIDSATLMNKGLEVIEAKWLFDVKAEQIEVVVHPQSIIHSMVQFTDGSIKAQMGLPDMKLPIQYAFAYPNRISNHFERFNFSKYPELTFEKPDTDSFPCLKIAYEALQKGGYYPCILNAANEIAVDCFLKNTIRFTDIANVVEHSMQQCHKPTNMNYETLRQVDKEARIIALNYAHSIKI